MSIKLFHGVLSKKKIMLIIHITKWPFYVIFVIMVIYYIYMKLCQGYMQLLLELQATQMRTSNGEINTTKTGVS